MHMPADAPQAPILTADPQRRLEQLLAILARERWPLPAGALPTGTALVGGAVRDGLLGRMAERPDLDLIVPGDGSALACDLAERFGGSWVPLDPLRGIGRWLRRGWTIDLARREGPDLESDLARRDYSVNAIALPLEPGAPLVDPQGGQADLARGLLRAIGEANLLADPLRLLRGPRLAAELGLRLDADSETWIHRHAGRLGEVAGERVLAELERLAAAAAGGTWLERVRQLGLLTPWGAPQPEASAPAPAALDPQRASAAGLTPEESAWALPLARLASLLDGATLERLRASRRLQQRCERLRHGWGLLEGQELEAAGLGEADRLGLQTALEDDWPAFALALPTAAAQASLTRWRDGGDPLFHPRPPINGAALQRALGLTPGPALGALIAHLTQERAFGRLAASADPLAPARRWLEATGEGRRD